MNKITLEVHVPAIDRIYDVVVPEKAKVYEVTPLLASVVTKLAEGLYIPNDPVICDGETGKVYNNHHTLEQLKLKNGSRVMLV